MSWDIEGDNADKDGKWHIDELSEDTAYDFMVNYGIYTSADADTLEKTATQQLPTGATLPYGTRAASPESIKLLKGAIWNAGVTLAGAAAVAASLY